MKKIKLWYSDFFQGFDPSNNYLQNLLSRHYDIVLDPQNPDYLIYSCYGRNFLKYSNTVKIFYTGENLIPDFNLCDYAIGFCYLEFGDRYLRYPNFALIEDQFLKLVKPKPLTAHDFTKKELFCNFIYSNSKANPARDQFFHLLSNYKTVVSPGSHLNNTSMEVGGRFTEDWMYTKLNLQAKCKFSIAFENSSSPGYTTEKLMHAYITNTIPIYWGNAVVARDFNPNSLINCHDFNDFQEVVEIVKEIDKNEELALKYLKESPFPDNEIPLTLKQITLETFLKSVFDQDLKHAHRRPEYGTILEYEKSLKSTRNEGKNKHFSALKKILRLK